MTKGEDKEFQDVYLATLQAIENSQTLSEQQKVNQKCFLEVTSAINSAGYAVLKLLSDLEGDDDQSTECKT